MATTEVLAHADPPPLPFIHPEAIFPTPPRSFCSSRALVCPVRALGRQGEAIFGSIRPNPRMATGHRRSWMSVQEECRRNVRGPGLIGFHVMFDLGRDERLVPRQRASLEFARSGSVAELPLRWPRQQCRPSRILLSQARIEQINDSITIQTFVTVLTRQLP